MFRKPKKNKEQKSLNDKKEISITEADVLDPSMPKVINRLVGSLGSALEEDESNFDELLGPETIENDASPAVNNPIGFFPRRIYTVLGFIVLFLSVIGTITCVNFISDFIYDVADQRSLKKEFAVFVYPVVITDPPEFKNAENLHTLTIISSSVWNIILSGNTERYEKTMGMMVVPAIDVEASARSLFGYGYEIEHRTIKDVNFTFEYDPERNSYIVPENPRYMTYAPRISEVSNVGELYKVTVEYIAPNTLSVEGVIYDENPIKTLVYTISRSREKMTINSIEYPLKTEELYS